MTKVRTLAPLNDPKTGEAIASGAEVDVDEETAKQWRAEGKASSIDEEQAQAKQPGHFQERTGREDVASTKSEQPTQPPEEKTK